MIQKNDTDRNRGGRPAKGLSEKRKYRITVKMATGEYYALKSKARKAGVSASEMVRQAVDGCVVRERLTTEQADFIRKLCGMANNLNQLARIGLGIAFVPDYCIPDEDRKSTRLNSSHIL